MTYDAPLLGEIFTAPTRLSKDEANQIWSP